ncbi:hypothetical protein D3C84_691590 [compost metagenome]
MLEVLAVLHATATGHHDLGGGQFRTVGLGQLFADEGGLAGVGDGAHGFDGSGAAFGSCGVETGATHGDHLHGSGGLHGGDGVTGVDRPLEGVGALDGDDLGDLVDVQQGGHARQVVLAVGGGGGQYVAVALAKLGDQRSDVFRQLMGVGGVIGHQDLGHAGDLGGGFGSGAYALACDQHVDITTYLLRSGYGVEGGGCQCGVRVFSNNQDSHQITFASFFSLSTSSATDLTLIPAWRAAGASTFRVFTVEAVETPRASGVTTSSGFFLAFMMFGSDA